MLLAAHRRVQRDIVRRFRVACPAVDVERLADSPTVVLGGFGAVVARLGGVNRIADYTTVLFYGDPDLPDLPPARFYSSEQTERSRAVLDEVTATVPEAVLIGGWGSWVRTKGPTSHDMLSSWVRHR